MLNKTCYYYTDEFCDYYKKRAIDKTLQVYKPKCDKEFCPILHPELLNTIDLVEK